MATKNTTKQEQNSTQQQQQKSLIDPRVEGTYANIADMVGQGLNSIDRSPWVGPAVAGRNAYDDKALGGMDSILGALKSNFQPGTFTNVALDAASGRLLDPATNPTLTGMINASTQPITEKLNRQIIPGMDAASIADNAFGGDRAALMKGQAYGDWAESAGNIAAGINYDNYKSERTNQLNAAQLYQQAMGAELAIPQAYAQAGDYQRMLDQKGIDDQLMQRVLQEQMGFAGLGQATSILNALPFVGQQSNGTSSSTGTTTQVTKQDPLMVAAQGALGLGSTLAGLGWNPMGGGGVAGAAPMPANPMATGYIPPYMLQTMQGLGLGAVAKG